MSPPGGSEDPLTLCVSGLIRVEQQLFLALTDAAVCCPAGFKANTHSELKHEAEAGLTGT